MNGAGYYANRSGGRPGHVHRNDADRQTEDDLADYDIAEVRSMQAVTGGLILEIPNADGAVKADKLAVRMKEILGEMSVRVTRPMKRVVVQLVG